MRERNNLIIFWNFTDKMVQILAAGSLHACVLWSNRRHQLKAKIKKLETK